MFIKGMPRPSNSGRQKGSQNKKRVIKVAELLAERDINPAQKIVEIIEWAEKGEITGINDIKKYLTAKERADIWLDLLSYCEAKPKAIESLYDDGFNSENFEDVSSEDLLKIVKDSNEAS